MFDRIKPLALSPPLPKLLLSGLVSFALFVLVLLLLAQTNTRQHDTLMGDYGNTVTQLSAAQLAVPLNANNLIGLQALITKLSQHRRILNAIIYDVDNRILVQAGSAQKPLFEHRDFTASIDLDQTLLGSLTITLDTRGEQQQALYFVLVFSFFASIFASLWLTAQVLRRDNAKPSSIMPIHGDNFAAEQNSALNKVTSKATNKAPSIAPVQILAIVKIQTLDKLFQQLNADVRQQQLEDFETTLNKVIKLYSGTLFILSDDALAISFTSPTLSESIFQAICFSYLLQKTTQQQQSMVEFHTTIARSCEHSAIKDEVLKRRELLVDNRSEHVLISSDLLEQSCISDRFILQANEQYQAKGFTCIQGFTQNYQLLLDNQLKVLN